MMLRNRECRGFAVFFCFLAAAATAAGFAISLAAGMLAAVSCAALGAAFFVFTKVRYDRIARLSAQIDRVLHHAERMDIGEAQEGELSILHSEITKMTLRIREQNEALEKEKGFLADSLADIAHQLRTPLTSANLILSLLAGTPAEDERQALARQARELLARMDWLLTSLLKLSRLDAGIVAFQSGRVEVNGLIGAALRPLQIPMELHHIALHLEVPAGAAVWGDAGWLAQALQNIFKNCMESAGDNGEIAVSCTDNPLFCEIVIRDNGPGFSREDLPFVFERFYRGKGGGAPGYGIGLALCKKIVTRQGGTVTAKNHPQGGAVFAVRFPK